MFHFVNDKLNFLSSKHSKLLQQVTGHVGVDKAGEVLRIEIRHIPVDPVTMRPDMKKFRAAIDSNTCMVGMQCDRILNIFISNENAPNIIAFMPKSVQNSVKC